MAIESVAILRRHRQGGLQNSAAVLLSEAVGRLDERIDEVAGSDDPDVAKMGTDPGCRSCAICWGPLSLGRGVNSNPSETGP